MSRKATPPRSTEGRLDGLGIQLPAAPTPLGTYVEALQTGELLFLSGMLPIVDHKPVYVGTLGSGLDTNAGRDAARITALNALAAAKDHLGSLERIRRVVRIGVFMATSEGFIDHPGSLTERRIFFAMSLAHKTWRFVLLSESPAFRWVSQLNSK